MSLGHSTAPSDLVIFEGVKRERVFPLELGYWLLSKRAMSFVTCLVHLRGADPPVPAPTQSPVQSRTGKAQGQWDQVPALP